MCATYSVTWNDSIFTRLYATNSRIDHAYIDTPLPVFWPMIGGGKELEKHRRLKEN